MFHVMFFASAVLWGNLARWAWQAGRWDAFVFLMAVPLVLLYLALGSRDE